MPVLVAGLLLCCWCQLPAWSVAARASCRLDAGASCRLRVVLLVPAAGLVSCCRLDGGAYGAGLVSCCRLDGGAYGAGASG
ncbi:hypothetical protein PR001_g31185 [Phytophthora rubi]|uniref:Secreted protein n=1 Tax=Phytophthora rubi TaxID=129364 RepID=A0A6A3GKS7_9STRA|nr:hypothetical protein PR001_g31185 [Phytophthora rubi]